MLQEEYEGLRKRYWGQHLWARGYFCATVGSVTKEKIQEYIANQFKEEDGDGHFKIEPDEFQS
jgi:putative transposase